MKNNKYRWRRLSEETPPIRCDIEVVGHRSRGISSTCRIHKIGDQFRLCEKGHEELIIGNDLMDFLMWKPLKSKKRKYRWRDMKNEEPDIGWIFIASNEENANILDKIPVAIEVVQVKDEKIVLAMMKNIRHPIQLNRDSFLWRKMCKLPGEK